MSAEARWRQVGGTAAERYERELVPALFAPWSPLLLAGAEVQPGERVLDVACGTGVVTRAVAARVGARGSVTGLDINGAMLGVARSIAVDGAAVDWVEASALEMPFPDCDFDAVVCSQGVQQFPDRPAAVREMYRVVRLRGRIAVSVWAELEANPGSAALVAALGRHVNTAAADNRRAPCALGNADDLRGLLIDAGFEDVDVDRRELHARYASAAALVDAQLSASPLSTAGAISAEARQAVIDDVAAALADYVDSDGLLVPMTSNIATGSKRRE